MNVNFLFAKVIRAIMLKKHCAKFVCILFNLMLMLKDRLDKIKAVKVFLIYVYGNALLILLQISENQSILIKIPI
jgi:hypothetical protein